MGVLTRNKASFSWQQILFTVIQHSHHIRSCMSSTAQKCKMITAIFFACAKERFVIGFMYQHKIRMM